GTERTIPPNGQTTFFLDVPSGPVRIDVRSGQVVVRTIRARYNSRGDLIFTALPNFGLTFYRQIVFPLVVNDGEYSTQFVVECISQCGGSVKVLSQSGDVLKIPIQ